MQSDAQHRELVNNAAHAEIAELLQAVSKFCLQTGFFWQMQISRRKQKLNAFENSRTISVVKSHSHQHEAIAMLSTLAQGSEKHDEIFYHQYCNGDKERFRQSYDIKRRNLPRERPPCEAQKNQAIRLVSLPPPRKICSGLYLKPSSGYDKMPSKSRTNYPASSPKCGCRCDP